MKQHGQRIAYIRVSTTDQHLDRQLAAIGEVDKVFTETQSGSSRAARPVLAEMINYVRQHDQVIVTSMDRLARSVIDLNTIVHDILAKGASIHFITENLTYTPHTSNAFAELQLNIMASFAQFERAIIRERQAEGIKAAKANGVYTGRKPKLSDTDLAAIDKDIANGVPKSVIARRYNIHRSTLYRALKDHTTPPTV